MNRYKLYFLSGIFLLGIVCGAAAQNRARKLTIKRAAIPEKMNGVTWLHLMDACMDVAMEQANNRYAALQQQALYKGIAVRLTVKTDYFDVEKELVKGVNDDEVIMNFYGALISDTGTNKYNCTGALWVGSQPASLR